MRPLILIGRALIGLLAFDLFFRNDFSRLHRVVCNWKLRSRATPLDDTNQICDALNYACMWYPKRALCLQRSSVLTCLLRSCGVPAQMVLGAQKLPFKAHAWVEVNGQPVNERSNVQAIYGVWERC